VRNLLICNNLHTSRINSDMKLLPLSVSISLGIPTLENKLIKALETVLASC
jgi:hypothetical protein